MHHVAARTSLLASGLILLFLSQWVLQDLPLDQRHKAAWLLLASIIMVASALVTIVRYREESSKLDRFFEATSHWFCSSPWQVVFLTLSPLFSYAATLGAGLGREMVSPFAAVLAWILAITMSMIGSRARDTGAQVAQRHWSDLWLLIGVTMFAFLVRGIATDRFPILLTGDEGSAGLDAARFVNGEMNNPFIAAWYSFPSLFFFIQSLSIRIFGQTIIALRVVSAIAGALTVTAVYYFAHHMFGRRVAVLAALFLAVLNFHVHFSRIGLNNIWDGLWFTVMLGALWHGWKNENFASFALAGFGLGMAQYFYSSGRALLPLGLGWLVVVGVFNFKKFKRNFAGVITMLTVAFTVALPIAVFYITFPNEFKAPFLRVSIFGPILESMVQSTGDPAWLVLLKQIWLSFQGFTYLPMRFWYQPGTPLLRPLPATLFLIGLLLLLIKDREHRFLLIGFWIATFGIIGGLSESPPASQRYVAVTPVCALMVGYGLSETAAIFESFWSKYRRSIVAGIAFIAIFLIASELHFYFVEYTQKTIIEKSRSNDMVAQQLANFLQTQPSDLQVVMSGQPRMSYYSIPSLQYLAPHIQGIDMLEVLSSPKNPILDGKNLLFVFLPENIGEIETIRSQFPGGKLYKKPASDGEPLYWYYEFHR